MEKLNPAELTQAFSHLIAQIAVAPTGARLAAISGQVAVDAAGTLVGGSDHAAQARQCFANIRAALAALDVCPRDMLQMKIHVVGHRPDLVPAIFAAGRDVFGDSWPVCASTWIGVETLAMPEWLVEIDALVAVS
ncbi:RidA family protein [Mesorhizobium yinganensis]|uniref:RidA family protein n=1 Tax=Mesorhizobium yinganensis TaxID=3157707 RepID=UPI0032B7E392